MERRSKMHILKSETVDKFIEEIKNLQTAESILLDIWTGLGSYFNGELSDETKERIRQYFKFDDSE
jgi:hypothetical protein